MAKLTLLDMTQSILGTINGDLVNDISDTQESSDIAQIIKDTYFELFDMLDMKQHDSTVQLESTNAATPTTLKLPNNVVELKVFRYDKIRQGETLKQYDKIHYMYPDEFLQLVHQRNNNSSDIEVVNDVSSNVELLVYNDLPPTWWTSFDDTYIVCDSYERAVESNLQQSKTACVAKVQASWSQVSDFVPDIPPDAFPLLLEEARSKSFAWVKQVNDQKAEQAAKRQRWSMSRKNFKARGGVRYPNYGRHGPKDLVPRDPTFRRR